jgi:hypothetical protein
MIYDYVTQCVVTNKLTSAIFAKIILFVARLFAISLYTLAIKAIESNFYCHIAKIQLYSLITKILNQHTFKTPQKIQPNFCPLDLNSRSLKTI